MVMGKVPSSINFEKLHENFVSGKLQTENFWPFSVFYYLACT